MESQGLSGSVPLWLLTHGLSTGTELVLAGESLVSNACDAEATLLLQAGACLKSQADAELFVIVVVCVRLSRRGGT